MNEEVVDLTSDFEGGKEMNSKGVNGEDIAVNNGKAEQESIELNTRMQGKMDNTNNKKNANLVESIEEIEKRKDELKKKMAVLRKLDTVCHRCVENIAAVLYTPKD